MLQLISSSLYTIKKEKNITGKRKEGKRNKGKDNATTWKQNQQYKTLEVGLNSCQSSFSVHLGTLRVQNFSSALIWYASKQPMHPLERTRGQALKEVLSILGSLRQKCRSMVKSAPHCLQSAPDNIHWSGWATLKSFFFYSPSFFFLGWRDCYKLDIEPSVTETLIKNHWCWKLKWAALHKIIARNLYNHLKPNKFFFLYFGK